MMVHLTDSPWPNSRSLVSVTSPLRGGIALPKNSRTAAIAATTSVNITSCQSL